jgi:hypothetical protein
MPAALPRNGRTRDQSAARGHDDAGKSLLHISAQRRVECKLGRFGPTGRPIGMPLGSRCPILQPAAAGGRVAPQLTGDCRGCPPEATPDRLYGVAVHPQKSSRALPNCSSCCATKYLTSADRRGNHRQPDRRQSLTSLRRSASGSGRFPASGSGLRMRRKHNARLVAASEPKEVSAPNSVGPRRAREARRLSIKCRPEKPCLERIRCAVRRLPLRR